MPHAGSAIGCIPQVKAAHVFYCNYTVKISSWHNTKALKPPWVGPTVGHDFMCLAPLASFIDIAN